MSTDAMTPCALSGPARAFPAAEYVRRLRRLQAGLRQARLDGLLLWGEVNRLYYTGFASSNGLLLVDAKRGPRFLTDFRYLFMARAALPFLSCTLLKRGPEADAQLLQLTRGWRRVGHEGSLSNVRFAKLQKLLESVRDWQDGEPAIAAQRAIKSPREQQTLRRAMRANDAMLAAVLDQVRPGLSEWEIRALVRREADRLGQGESFDCIPCVGANAAECHHQPGRDVLRDNQPLLLDLGLKLDHYCADLTRTIFFGKPTRLYREVHAIVLAANRRAIRAIRPGMTGQEVDAIARRHIEKAGYGKAFGHGLGHALGLEVHEQPAFAPSCQEKIRAGMVLTVEPGIYLPGRVGVRIEDVVLITRTGCEVLSHAPHWLER